MLTLWSRALRTQRTCRCIQCVSNTSAIARRTFPFGTPTSTFAYTAVFAAGIAIDGRAKLRRNQQWEEAFSHLREESEEVAIGDEQVEHIDDRRPIEKTGYGRFDALAEAGIYTGPHKHTITFLEELNDIDWHAMGRVVGTELDPDDRVLPREHLERKPEYISEDFWELLEYDSQFPGSQAWGWPVNTGPDLQRKNLPPQSLWSYDAVREKALRRRHTWKKLSIQELSMGLLAISLVSKARELNVSPEIVSNFAFLVQDIVQSEEEKVERIFGEILKGLRTIELLPDTSSEEIIHEVKEALGHLPIAHYVQDNDGDFYYIGQQMNDNIRRVLGNDLITFRTESELGHALAKVAHNLLITTAGPDVQTFNLLINGLKRWQLPDLVDRAITAFTSCKIRPNELTLCAILDHYVQENRPLLFSDFIEKMQGKNGGLMLAIPNVNINEASEGRLIRHKEHKLIQKIHPTPMVFNTLMRGVLKFTGLHRSLEIYYELKDDGWGLGMSTLNYFLQECLYQSDWNAGLYIWEEICSIRHKVKRQDMGLAYATMLSLCSVTGNTVAFNHVLNEVVRGKFDRKTILGAAMSTVEKMQSRQTSTTPAFTADNVLIAASGLLNGPEPTVAVDQDHYIERKEGVADYPDSTPPPREGPFKDESVKEEPTKEEDRWKTWLQHELNLGNKG